MQYRGFVKPQETLERSLESNRDRGSTPLPRKRPNYRNVDSPTDEVEGDGGFFADGLEMGEMDGRLEGDSGNEVEKVWIHQDEAQGNGKKSGCQVQSLY